MKKTIIITAGGIGKRMGGDLPKQFLIVNGYPILMHTLAQFHHFDPQAQLLLTLPEDWKTYWENLCEKYSFNIEHQVISGGIERYHSIKNALQQANGEYVYVHDGVRPMVNQHTLNACEEALHQFQAVIPVIPVKDSLRQIGQQGNIATDRTAYRLVQTPQCFHRDVLMQAYQQDFHEGITDDASLVEAIGVAIHLVSGNEENIKITTPFDLQIAELLLKNYNN